MRENCCQCKALGCGTSQVKANDPTTVATAAPSSQPNSRRPEDNVKGIRPTHPTGKPNADEQGERGNEIILLDRLHQKDDCPQQQKTHQLFGNISVQDRPAWAKTRSSAGRPRSIHRASHTQADGSEAQIGDFGRLLDQKAEDRAQAGSLQGVAKMVVMMPLAKAPPICAACRRLTVAPDPTKPGMGFPTRPRSSSAMANTRPASEMVKPIELKCSPQPSLNDTARVASTRNTTIMPAE